MKISKVRDALDAILGFRPPQGTDPQFEHYYADLIERDFAVAPRADEALHDYEEMLRSHLAG
jgi:hypothetical protein